MKYIQNSIKNVQNNITQYNMTVIIVTNINLTIRQSINNQFASCTSYFKGANYIHNYMYTDGFPATNILV